MAVAAETDLSCDEQVGVNLDSLETNVGYSSLPRELQHAYIERVAFLRSKAGGALSPDEARAKPITHARMGRKLSESTTS